MSLGAPRRNTAWAAGERNGRLSPVYIVPPFDDPYDWSFPPDATKGAYMPGCYRIGVALAVLSMAVLGLGMGCGPGVSAERADAQDGHEAVPRRVAPLVENGAKASSVRIEDLLAKIRGLGFAVSVAAYPPGTASVLERDLARLLEVVSSLNVRPREVQRQVSVSTGSYPLRPGAVLAEAERLPIVLLPATEDLRPLLRSWALEPPEGVRPFVRLYDQSRMDQEDPWWAAVFHVPGAERVAFTGSFAIVPVPLGTSHADLRRLEPDVASADFSRIVTPSIPGLWKEIFGANSPIRSMIPEDRAFTAAYALTDSVYVYADTRASEGIHLEIVDSLEGLEYWQLAYPVADALGVARDPAVLDLWMDITVTEGPEAPILPKPGLARDVWAAPHAVVAIDEQMLAFSSIWSVHIGVDGAPLREQWTLRPGVPGPGGTYEDSLRALCLAGKASDEEIRSALAATRPVR